MNTLYTPGNESRLYNFCKLLIDEIFLESCWGRKTRSEKLYAFDRFAEICEEKKKELYSFLVDFNATENIRDKKHFAPRLARVKAIYNTYCMISDELHFYSSPTEGDKLFIMQKSASALSVHITANLIDADKVCANLRGADKAFDNLGPTNDVPHNAESKKKLSLPNKLLKFLSYKTEI